MRDFNSRIAECLSAVKWDYGSIFDVPNANDILLNYEHMNSARMAYATHDVNSPEVSNIISLNVDYIGEYRTLFEYEVIPHELAHVICFNNLAGESNHGDAWSQLCVSMGGTGSKFISMESRV